jgi:VWFA-related protein
MRLSILGLAGALCAAPIPRLLAQGPPVFRARTELVCLDVSVTDKDGHLVDDLRADEIAISENGHPRPVVLFRHLADSTRQADEPAGGFEEVSGNGLPSSGQLYVLVFDQLHIAAGHEQRALLAAERFLTHELKPGDAVAIYGLPGPGPMLDFTTDLIRARARLREVRGKAGRPAGGVSEFDAYRVARGGRAVSDVLETGRPSQMVDASLPGMGAAGADARFAAGEVLSEQASHVVAQADAQAQIFLSQLAGVMRKLRMIDGRKAFILFSEGFFVDDLAPQLEQVAAAAAQSHSLVYSIDLNRSDLVGQGSIMSAAELSGRRDPLATLALETNGRLLTNATDINRTLSQIAAETNDYYLVGFEPPASNGPPEYHRVKVSVTRRGLVANARTGYSTTPAPTALAERQAIDVALGVPRTSTALPIEYTTYERIGQSAGKPRIIVSVNAEVPARRSAEESAEIVFVVRDAVTGQAAASGTDHVRLAASSSDAPGHLDALQYAVQFDVPPGEYWMRVLVRDPGGIIGTADRRFHVWSLDGGALSTSDLIVTRLDGARFDPPAQAAVHRDDDVLAYLELYGPGPAIQSADARVEILRADSSEVIATAKPVVKPGSRGERIVRALLPVAGLAEGWYAARVRILAPNQLPRTIMRTFRIVSGEPKPRAQ